MRKISRKAEGSNMDILVIIIVGLVALALLLSIIFRANILNFIRNLPDYGNSQEDRVIDIGDDTVIDNVAKCEKVGELVTIKREGFWQSSGAMLKDIFSEPALYYISIGGTKTDLYVYQYKEILKIELDESGDNEDAGQIINQKILIDDKWINDGSLRMEHSLLPDVDSLKLIDDGYLNGLSICKKLEAKP